MQHFQPVLQNTKSESYFCVNVAFCMAAQNTADATVKFIFVSSVEVSVNFSDFVSGVFVECRLQICQLIFLKIWCRY